ncbi:MAG: nucleoside hydrolase [Candidatus Brocadiia bacterium]
MAEGPAPVFVDTDIGDDIDDALALALVLNSPEVELRGVSVVFGDVATRARLALKLLAAYGRSDVPVAIGRAAPLLGPPPDSSPNQAVVLEEGEELPRPQACTADELILGTAAQTDGELTVITIGAMTNMALALLRDPGLARRARLVVMGGAVGWQQAEWNVRCDPEAARICFESGISLAMVGLDVTLKCQMSQGDVGQLANAGSEATALLARMTEAWARTGDGQGKRTPVLHDPLAVAVAWRPELVAWEPKCVRVETRGEFTRGFTVPVAGEPNAQVAVGVEAEAFLRLFMDRLLRPAGC